jgi:hypothetical protein
VIGWRAGREAETEAGAAGFGVILLLLIGDFLTVLVLLWLFDGVSDLAGFLIAGARLNPLIPRPEGERDAGEADELEAVDRADRGDLVVESGDFVGLITAAAAGLAVREETEEEEEVEAEREEDEEDFDDEIGLDMVEWTNANADAVQSRLVQSSPVQSNPMLFRRVD